MAKVVKKVTTVEFDSNDVWHVSKALADLNAFAASIKADADYRENKEERDLLNYYVQEIRRKVRHIEAFLPKEIRDF